MPSLILRRSSSAQDVLDPDADLAQQLAQAQAPGLIAAARLQSAGFAANVGIQQAAMLSMAASRAFKVSPLGADTYEAICLAYGSVAVAEVQSLGLHQNWGLR